MYDESYELGRLISFLPKGASSVKKYTRIATAFFFLVLVGGLLVVTTLLLAEEKKLTVEDYPDEVIRLVNEERAKSGLSPLTKSATLEAPALIRAQEQEKKFSHTRPNGSSWSTVFDDFGIYATYRGENLAYGQKTPAKVMKSWMESEGHRKNIMDPRFTEIAVGIYQNGGVTYWSQLFMDGGGTGQNTTRGILSGEGISSALPIAVVDGVNLNLRSQPNTSSEVVTILLDGTEVNLLEIDKNWARVRTEDGTEGWASAKHLAIQ